MTHGDGSHGGADDGEEFTLSEAELQKSIEGAQADGDGEGGDSTADVDTDRFTTASETRTARGEGGSTGAPPTTPDAPTKTTTRTVPGRGDTVLSQAATVRVKAPDVQESLARGRVMRQLQEQTQAQLSGEDVQIQQRGDQFVATLSQTGERAEAAARAPLQNTPLEAVTERGAELDARFDQFRERNREAVFDRIGLQEEFNEATPDVRERTLEQAPDVSVSAEDITEAAANAPTTPADFIPGITQPETERAVEGTTRGLPGATAVGPGGAVGAGRGALTLRRAAAGAGITTGAAAVGASADTGTPTTRATASVMGLPDQEIPVSEPVQDRPDLRTPAEDPVASGEVDIPAGADFLPTEMQPTATGRPPELQPEPGVQDRPEIPLGDTGGATGGQVREQTGGDIVPGDFPLIGRDIPAQRGRDVAARPDLQTAQQLAQTDLETIQEEAERRRVRERRRRERDRELREILRGPDETVILGEEPAGIERPRDMEREFFTGASAVVGRDIAAQDQMQLQEIAEADPIEFRERQDLRQQIDVLPDVQTDVLPAVDTMQDARLDVLQDQALAQQQRQQQLQKQAPGQATDTVAENVPETTPESVFEPGPGFATPTLTAPATGIPSTLGVSIGPPDSPDDDPRGRAFQIKEEQFVFDVPGVDDILGAGIDE